MITVTVIWPDDNIVIWMLILNFHKNWSGIFEIRTLLTVGRENIRNFLQLRWRIQKIALGRKENMDKFTKGNYLCSNGYTGRKLQFRRTTRVLPMVLPAMTAGNFFEYWQTWVLQTTRPTVLINNLGAVPHKNASEFSKRCGNSWIKLLPTK